MRTASMVALLCLAVVLSACSTTTVFKLPPNADVRIYGREQLQGAGQQYTRPFFWTAISGIEYEIIERDKGNVVQTGKLAPAFRVPSIFWPPYAIIYWPVGYGWECYDLTGDTPQSCQADSSEVASE